MNCAPGNKNKSLLSCYSRDQLRKMVKAIRKDNNQSNENLIKTLRKEFPDCIDESCFLEQEPIKNVIDKEMREYTFKPQMPNAWLKDRNTWLSTTDIQKVMKQYEREYTDFKYYGPFPIDCPVEINCEVTNLDLKKHLKQGKKRIGIGYNLDKHYQPGSHWVSLYIDIPNSTIIYYDSTSGEAPYILRQFIEFLLKQLEGLNNKARFDYNRKQHQFGGSECGVYSMNFLVEMLKGKTLEDFQKKKVSDFSVNLLRDYFYRTNQKKVKY